MSLHSPERQQNESQADYRARRAQSNEVARAAMLPTNPPRFTQHVGKAGLSRRDKHRSNVRAAAYTAGLATTPKPLDVRTRKPKKAIAPTWPHSDDQKGQQRALIVLGKNRERDASKRAKPKSAVAKRMDRPSRVAIVDAGHAKLMRFLSGFKA